LLEVIASSKLLDLIHGKLSMLLFSKEKKPLEICTNWKCCRQDRNFDIQLVTTLILSLITSQSGRMSNSIELKCNLKTLFLAIQSMHLSTITLSCKTLSSSPNSSLKWFHQMFRWSISHPTLSARRWLVLKPKSLWWGFSLQRTNKKQRLSRLKLWHAHSLTKLKLMDKQSTFKRDLVFKLRSSCLESKVL
jgi:hypothetical protein